MFTTSRGGFNDTIRIVLKELRTFLTFVGLVMLGFAFAFYCLFRWIITSHREGVWTRLPAYASLPVYQVHAHGRLTACPFGRASSKGRTPGQANGTCPRLPCVQVAEAYR